ncbi:MAG: hypothetical protein IPI67_40175 [Myxococcales bacterium]|nr:hypothetical protein [Myxococcales bacterium]
MEQILLCPFFMKPLSQLGPRPRKLGRRPAYPSVVGVGLAAALAACGSNPDDVAARPQGGSSPSLVAAGAQMVGEDRRSDFVIGHVDTGIDPSAAARLQRTKDRVEATCAGCELAPRCQSHCGCKHIALTGQLGEITEALCETEAAFVAAADRVAEAMFAEQNPEFLDLYYRRRWVPAPGGQLTRLRLAADRS